VTKRKTAEGDKKKKSSATAKRSKSEAPTKQKGKEVGSAKTSKYDHFWQYQDSATQWKNYDEKASDTVEEVYLNYLSNRGDTDVRAVKSGQWEYMVDFMALKQTNIQHENHTVRNIRRLPVAN